MSRYISNTSSESDSEDSVTYRRKTKRHTHSHVASVPKKKDSTQRTANEKGSPHVELPRSSANAPSSSSHRITSRHSQDPVRSAKSRHHNSPEPSKHCDASRRQPRSRSPHAVSSPQEAVHTDDALAVPRSQNLDCPEPQKFTGLPADLPSWLDSFTNYAETVELEQDSWTKYALCYMPWTVREFVSMSAAEYGYATLPTFAIFTALLYNMYYGIDHECYFSRLAYEAKQAFNEKVRAFGVRLYGYVKNANLFFTTVTEINAIILFIAGLRNDDMKQYLTLKRLKNRSRLRGRVPKTRTLEDYIEAASIHEHAYDLTPKTMVDAQTQTTEQAPPSTQSTLLNTAIAGLHLIKVHLICFNCNTSGHNFRQCPYQINNAVVQAKLAEARANNVRRDAAVEAAKRAAITNAASSAPATLTKL